MVLSNARRTWIQLDRKLSRTEEGGRVHAVKIVKAGCPEADLNARGLLQRAGRPCQSIAKAEALHERLGILRRQIL